MLLCIFDRDKPNYPIHTQIRYWVGTPPGYLDEGRVKDETHACFVAWAEACPLTFKQVGVRDLADVCIEWRDESEDGFVFDGIGGLLAHSRKNFVHFDPSERWKTKDQRSEDDGYYFQVGRIFYPNNSTP